MSKLKEYRFTDLYEMASGISSTKEQAGHGSPFLSFSTVFNNYFVPETLSDLMNTCEKDQETFSVQNGDIFLTRTSEVVDELGMSSVAIKDYPNATFSGFLKRLRPTKSKVTYPKYMAFYLRSQLFRKTMTNNAVMTLRASLNEAIFSYLELLLPEYDDQVKAGDFLFLMNQKIELNNRINTELEAMAKTLYDYWFVQFDFPLDFAQGKPAVNGKPYKSSGGKMVYNPILKREIPEEWEATTVGKIAKTALGGTPSTEVDDYWENADIPWLSSAETASFPVVGSEQKITQKGLENSAATLLPKGTVVISIVRYIRPSILAFDAATNQSVVGIKECSRLKSSFIYPYFCSEVPRLMGLRTGAQQPHINKGVIDESPIVLPTDYLLEEYYKKVDPIYDQIMTLAFESRDLIELRDWLLPMLMNGQVTVK